jgi:hypothetical protein
MLREISFRYDLLRNGAFYAFLKADESAVPTIRMDDSAEIKTGFSASFAPTARDADGAPMPINWLTDEIEPVMILNGAEYPLGVFMPAKVTYTKRMGAQRVNVDCYDRCWRVRDTKSASLLYWPSGTAYLDAIKQLLAGAGIGTVFAGVSSAVFSTDREDWPLGVSYLTVVNDLLEEINFKPLYFDETGAAILEPAVLPTADNIKQVFDMSDPETLCVPEVSREADYYEAPNVFIVCCANPDMDGNLIARAANENPQSPLSVQRRGREIVSVQQVDNIANQDELNAYAAWLRDKSIITGEKLHPKTGLRPGFGVGIAVGFIDKDDDIVAVGIEHAYTMPLKAGAQMDHSVERIVYNLD